MSRLPKPKSEKIVAGKLTVDHSYQREAIPARIKAIAENIDLDGLGVLTVSRRKDGTNVIIDGQHRVEALRYHGFDEEWDVECRVYTGLTTEQEAALYRHLNNTRRITAWDEFKAGLVAGDVECLAIDAIVKANGLKVSSYAGDAKVMCVAALRNIHKRYGGDALGGALGMVTSAWGHTANAVEKDIVIGASIVCATFNGEIEKPSMVKKLAKTPGGPSGLLGRARGIREMQSAPISRIVAQQMVATYNKGRRTNLLDEL